VGAGSTRRGRDALEGRSPGELRARAGLNHRLEVADFRVEQDPEGEGRRLGLHGRFVAFEWDPLWVSRAADKVVERAAAA